MKKISLYILAGCFLSSLLFISCGQQEEPSLFEKIQDEQPVIEAYVQTKGLEGLFNFQGVYVVTEYEGDTASSFVSSSSFIELVYTGTLLTGEVFSETGPDGLTTPSGELPRLNELISGLESGLKLFRKGGKGTLIIPSPLAYEEFGSTDGKVPPNAILRFDFTLLDFE